MANEYFVNSADLSCVADAIRAKGETSDELVFPSGFVAAIQDIKGGVELNFDVVGGETEPTNPKENTIWINTGTRIAGWTFGNNEPIEAVDGLVWIETNKNSDVKFNALNESENKNEIQMYPIKAHLYTSDGWVDVPMKHYANGSWHDVVVYLFKDGNQYTDITGGWINNTGFTFNSSNAAAGTVSIGQTIQCKTGTGKSSYASTAQKIDVSGYSSIVVHASDRGSKTYELALMPSTGNMADKAVAFKSLTVERNVLPINLTGAYYICVGTAGGETIEVTQIYLER